MRQKLALVRPLLHDPSILLLDEPTSAMDPESARMVRDSIRGVRSGDRTILLCTHNLFEAEEMADQIAIIKAGHLIMNDTREKLKKNLLGADEFELRITGSFEDRRFDPPLGFAIRYREGSILRFISPNPDMDNPQLLRGLLDNGFDVVSLHKIPQSLESAYLNAIRNGRDDPGATRLGGLLSVNSEAQDG